MLRQTAELVPSVRKEDSGMNSDAVMRHYDLLIERYPVLESVGGSILGAYDTLALSYERGGKLLIAGNGGSAADSEHIVGELMKSFLLPDKPVEELASAIMEVDPMLGAELVDGLQHALPAIALCGSPALTSAFANDCNPLLGFAQQVNGLGREDDVLLAISTSGNSRNVLYACVVARAKGMKVLGLTGARECELMRFSNVCIRVPETETFKIQELHLPVYHCLCAMLEERFFGKG